MEAESHRHLEVWNALAQLLILVVANDVRVDFELRLDLEERYQRELGQP